MSKVMTGFDPKVHGFAFNNGWRLADDLALLRVDVAEKKPIPYGMCGGMAYVALDYYHHGVRLPRGTVEGHPTHAAEGGRLRRYILWRLIISLIRNGLTFVAWYLTLHYLPGGEAGRRILGERSMREFEKIRARLDLGEPCVIGLVGMTRNISQDHQVIALGYALMGNIGLLFIHDNNHPNKVIEIGVDFGAGAVREDYPFSAKPLVGFFLERYRVRRPRRIEYP